MSTHERKRPYVITPAQHKAIVTVVRAWTIPGNHPSFHARVVSTIRNMAKPLADALGNLRKQPTGTLLLHDMGKTP